MASSPPQSIDDRDANLDALKEAADEWFDKEKTRLENETKFLRAVLEGRGMTDVLNKNLNLAADLVAAEVNAFIIGE